MTKAEREAMRAFFMLHGHMEYPDYIAASVSEFGRGISERTFYHWRRMFGFKPEKRNLRQSNNPMWSETGEKIQLDGSVKCRVIENGRSVWLYKNRVEWEKVHGPIPPGYRLVCLGDKHDCRPENWKMVPHSVASMAVIHSPIPLGTAHHDLKPALIALAEIKMKLKGK